MGELMNRFAENRTASNEFGGLVTSILSRNFEPTEYQVNLNISTGSAVRLYPRGNQIIIENFDRQQRQMSLVLKTQSEDSKDTTHIEVHISEGRGEKHHELRRGIIRVGENGKWHMSKQGDNVLQDLKTARTSLVATNDYLLHRDRQGGETRRRLLGVWSYIDIEEAPGSRQVAGYGVNEDSDSRPITYLTLFVPGTPEEVRAGEAVHLLRYITKGSPLAVASASGKERLEIYAIEPVIPDAEPQFVLISRKTINEDVTEEEVSVVFGSVFSFQALRDHIAHSMLGEVFTEWLQATQAAAIASLRNRIAT